MIFKRQTTKTTAKQTSLNAPDDYESGKQNNIKNKEKNRKRKQQKGLVHGRRQFWLPDQFQSFGFEIYELENSSIFELS